MAANLAQVARFCRIVPQRNPTTLIQVTATMATSATTWARVTTIPTAEKMTCSCDIAGNDSAQIRRRCHRKRGDGAAIGHAEQHPSIEKRGKVAVGFSQVNVLAAGVGEHRAQFGEGGASQQRNARAQNPDQQKQHGMRQGTSNVFCRQENRRANDAADQQQDGVEQAEAREPGWAIRIFAVDGDETEGRLIMWLSHPQFVGRFERSSTAAADDGRAVAASEGIVDFLAAPGTIKWLRVRLRLRG